MRIRNGYLFHKTNSKGDCLLASLHWYWSITWRWALWFRFTNKLRPYFRYTKTYFNQYFIAIHLPCMLFTFQTQENIKRNGES